MTSNLFGDELCFHTGDIFQYTNLDNGHTHQVEILVATMDQIAYESRGPLAPPHRGITDVASARTVLNDLGATRVLYEDEKLAE